MRPDFKRARQELTGNVPTGSYDMAGMEFSVTRKTWDGIVAELHAWPRVHYLKGFADFERWPDSQNDAE